MNKLLSFFMFAFMSSEAGGEKENASAASAEGLKWGRDGKGKS